MDYTSYQFVIGTIRDISMGESCCTWMVTVQTDTENINFVVTGDTRIIDNVRLRRGMRVAAFYDTSLPAPAIYPARYQAELITSLRRDQNAALKYFDENLLAEDESLQLNLSPLTIIETQNGQRYRCAPGNAELLVYYTVTTFSIPPQTTPQKIIVMCPRE